MGAHKLYLGLQTNRTDPYTAISNGIVYSEGREGIEKEIIESFLKRAPTETIPLMIEDAPLKYVENLVRRHRIVFGEAVTMNVLPFYINPIEMKRLRENVEMMQNTSPKLEEVVQYAHAS
jgi:hypothetical protein